MCFTPGFVLKLHKCTGRRIKPLTSMLLFVFLTASPPHTIANSRKLRGHNTLKLTPVNKKKTYSEILATTLWIYTLKVWCFCVSGVCVHIFTPVQMLFARSAAQTSPPGRRIECYLSSTAQLCWEGHRKLHLISIHLFIFSSCKIQTVIAIYSSGGLCISGSLLFMRNIKQSCCVTGVQDNGGRGARHSEIRNLAVWRRTQAESFQSERSRLRCLVKERNIDFAVKTASSSPPTNLFTQRY